MIASVLFLDRQAIQKLKIQDPYSMHKYVYSLFPSDQRRFLYYDQGGDLRYRRILLVSHEQPLVPEIGMIESKFIPGDFLEHQRYAFQVLLNPVEQPLGIWGKVPVVGREALRSWFARKQEIWGFASNTEDQEIFNLGVQIIHKNERDITYNMAEFRGVLEVTDRERFRNSFINGIGRGKAFGFGLLQIRPLKDK
ncbi:MAG: type I-E CRISPR-associated protein Cas6/Cse3/CasE [Sphaerochaeta sp.]|nr:type I-E CRISPR-associated protein Cas6/Cse3/CasE [Sphaerochaeta sp.]